ncbi:MAG: 50S ribosomal protein L24 [Clostridia bacterium]|nr:50S ribosomal protein L24 [Clostridia bacterium]MDE7328990.1 50S ribosomal protein L24 [Clostridia bacterium]
MNVKKGDAVKIIAGSDKGKTAQVLAVNVKSNRVVLKGDGLKTVKCFVKPRNAQEKGGIIEREPSVNVSNVMILCPSCNAATRVAHSISVDENGKSVKSRICKKCGASLDVKAAKAAKTAKKASKKATTAKESTEDTAVAKKEAKKPTATKAKKTTKVEEN